MTFIKRAVASAALGLVLVLAACSGDEVELDQTQQAVAVIAVTPITWNVIGLDSNDVTTGPATYQVGVRVANTGDAVATNVTATLSFTTANAFINVSGPSAITLSSLAPGASSDVYFNVAVTRNAAAFDTSRGYIITVAGTRVHDSDDALATRGLRRAPGVAEPQRNLVDHRSDRGQRG